MITLFSIPKAFQGHNGIIQRNAIRSWTLLQPQSEVILLADDEGTDQIAAELGVMHIPDVERNEFGTPLLNSAFQLAEAAASNPIVCFVNADIILTSSFTSAFKIVQESSDKFLVTGQRRDLEIDSLLDFGDGWEEELLLDVSKRGRLHHYTGIDFWGYPKGLLDGMPPMAVGRVAYESWCLYRARSSKAKLIDATKVVFSVHQEHNYSHHPGGLRGIGERVEAQRNREMVGGRRYFFIIKDRTHILSTKGLKRSLDGWRLWRGLRTATVLYPSAPLPVRLVVGFTNAGIDFGISFAKWLGVRRPYKLNIDSTDEK